MVHKYSQQFHPHSAKVDHTQRTISTRRIKQSSLCPPSRISLGRKKEAAANSWVNIRFTMFSERSHTGRRRECDLYFYLKLQKVRKQQKVEMKIRRKLETPATLMALAVWGANLSASIGLQILSEGTLLCKLHLYNNPPKSEKVSILLHQNHIQIPNQPLKKIFF